MVLVATGIYGLLSHALTRRTREIGIRTALEASSKAIVGLFVSEAAAMVALGTLIGVPGAPAAVTLPRYQLYGVEPHDPTTTVGYLACIIYTVGAATSAPYRASAANCTTTDIED